MKYVEFEYRPKKFIKNLSECENFSYRRLVKEFPTKNWKRWTLDDFLLKLRTTDSIERTVIYDFKICWVYVVLDLPGRL